MFRIVENTHLDFVDQSHIESTPSTKGEAHIVTPTNHGEDVIHVAHEVVQQLNVKIRDILMEDDGGLPKQMEPRPCQKYVYALALNPQAQTC